MDKDKLFAMAFRKFGPPLQRDGLPSDVQNRYAQQLGFYNNFDSTIHVGAIETGIFNAVATRTSGGEFIALFVGAISQLTLYAYQVFADPDAYKDIGDISNESCEHALLNKLREGDLSSIMSFRYMPNDPIRRNVAERIAECACLILFMHEAAHIRGCHLDLIRDELGLSEYEELSITPINEEESLLMRALELEADIVALANSLTIWRHLAEHTGRHSIEGLGPTRSWLIAAELLFWVMSFNHDRSREKLLASHPSLVTRFQNIRLLRGLGSEDKELIEAIEQPENTLFPWINRHRLSSPLLGYFDKSAYERDGAEWIELKEKIETLWPRLEEYRRARSKRLNIPFT